MSSLPAAWIAVGCLLLISLVVLAVLFVLKSREVATLKKEVDELRDTMRMMRYEEANLARMLHTANKPKEQLETPVKAQDEIPLVAPVEDVVENTATKDTTEEDTIEKASTEIFTEEPAEVPTEKTTEEDIKETVQEIAKETVSIETISEATPIEEPQEESPVVEEIETVAVTEAMVYETNQDILPAESATEEPVAEEQPISVEESIETSETDNNETVEMDEAVEAEVEETQPTLSTNQKHPINERRPAIPTDLFAAWFAENEDDTADEPAIEETFEAPASPVLNAIEQPVATDTVTTSSEETEKVMIAATDEQMPQEQAASESTEKASIAVPEMNKEDERFCRKLERIVTTRLRNPNLNIDIIAAQFGIGRTNFYRKVRELTGMSPNDYLRKCRMERAAELLCSSTEPVSDVCAQVGIPDAQYFSRVFKTYYGVTPSTYRENNK